MAFFKQENFYDHRFYNWMPEEGNTYRPALAENCKEGRLTQVISRLGMEGLRPGDCTFFPVGTFTEGDRPKLYNIPEFYRVRVYDWISPNAEACIKVYLPTKWNGRFMACSGAGMNLEFDWTIQGSNVMLWPMAVRNGFAAVVNEGGMGLDLCADWGFYPNGNTDWAWVHYFAFEAANRMIIVGKKITEAMYGEKIDKSYMCGCSLGGHQVLCQAGRYPESCDGFWADCPPVGLFDLALANFWPIAVFNSEQHDVSNIKFKAAYALAKSGNYADVEYIPGDKKWVPFFKSLLGLETVAGPITEEDLRVMIRIWNGPEFPEPTKGYWSFGPTILAWPIRHDRPFGFLRREKGEDGPVFIFPPLLLVLQWLMNDPTYNIKDITYAEYETLYHKFKWEMMGVRDDDPDLNELCECDHKLLITHGTGDYLVPWQRIRYFYTAAMHLGNSELDFMNHVRCFLIPHAGHSFYDWDAPNVVLKDAVTALMDWVEKGIAPESLPTKEYTFNGDITTREDEAIVYRANKK